MKRLFFVFEQTNLKTQTLFFIFQWVCYICLIFLNYKPQFLYEFF
jgi:hypothetical protein